MLFHAWAEMYTYQSGSVATKQGSVARRKTFALMWSKWCIIQTIVKAFFVRNPAVLMNGKIIFTQLTFKTTLLADKLTFKKLIIAKSKFWTHFVKNMHSFVTESSFKSVFNACFCFIPFSRVRIFRSMVREKCLHKNCQNSNLFSITTSLDVNSGHAEITKAFLLFLEG